MPRNGNRNPSCPNQRPLKKGDIVVINSGGPQMLIVGINGKDDDGNRMIKCRWRVKGGHEYNVWPEPCLRLV